MYIYRQYMHYDFQSFQHNSIILCINCYYQYYLLQLRPKFKQYYYVVCKYTSIYICITHTFLTIIITILQTRKSASNTKQISSRSTKAKLLYLDILVPKLFISSYLKNPRELLRSCRRHLRLVYQSHQMHQSYSSSYHRLLYLPHYLVQIPPNSSLNVQAKLLRR